MFCLHKKKRMVLSATLLAAILLPVMFFAVNKLTASDDTHAITYVMPDGYTNILDPNFYDCVVAAYKRTYPAIEIPATGITDEQLYTIDELVCNSRSDDEKIVNTTGLEKMPRMAYLDLSSNNITTIDVSQLPLLTNLNLHSNRLSSLNLSNNPSLRSLYVNNNQLTSLDVSQNLNLRTFDASYNFLTSIDVSNNTRLIDLRLQHNHLSYANVSNNNMLTLLNIDHNNIGAIDVSSNPSLVDLMADNIIVFYAGIEPTIINGNYVYNLSNLGFLEDGYHEGYIVDFSITNTGNYTYDETNKLLTVNDPDGVGPFIQIDGADDKGEGGFTYKFGLPYILTYDSNGGSGTFGPSLCYPNAETQVCLIEVPDGTPTMNGYIFAGWVDPGDAGTGSYFPGNNIAMLGNKTVYAGWELETTTVSLDFNLNGGEGDVATQTCDTDIEHPNCSVTIPNTVPTQDGYNFLGWANSSTATEAVYQPGSSVSLSQNKTVYAVWELITNTVSLNFDLNGGEGTIASQTCTLDIDHPTCNVNIPATVPTQDGYNFLGWANSSTATEAVYQPGGSVLLSQNKTVYAVWELMTNTASLNFDLNGGEGTMASRTCTFDIEHPNCTVTIPNTVPTQDGYNFLGWANSSTATEAVYQPGGSVTLNQNKTVYAVWKLITATVSLSFDLNGGEGAIATQSCEISAINPSCNIYIPTSLPTKDGYRFLGWAESATATTPDYRVGDGISLFEDKTIYAIWEIADTTVSLSFNLNGGEGEVAEQSCIININNPTCVVTVPETVPTKKNHEFLGWADDASALEESYIAGDEVPLDDNKTVYAVWNRTADDDEPADDEDDLPVPDTSAPDTGENTNDNGFSAVFTVAVLPVLAGAIYLVFRRNKKSHLRFD